MDAFRRAGDYPLVSPHAAQQLWQAGLMSFCPIPCHCVPLFTEAEMPYLSLLRKAPRFPHPPLCKLGRFTKERLLVSAVALRRRGALLARSGGRREPIRHETGLRT